MDNFIIFIGFVKTFILFLSIIVSIREIFVLYKSVVRKTEYDITPKRLTILGLCLSYILTIIFI